MAANRRTTVLAGILAVCLAVFFWTRAGLPAAPAESRPAARATRDAARAGAAETAPASGPVAVRLDALRADRELPDRGNRNPFVFGSRPAPPPPSAPPASFTPPAGPFVPAGPPPPPPITLKFIGTVEKADGVRVAVLSGGRSPLYGREGDIVDGQYRLLKIGEESLEIAYLDGRGRQTLRLSGQ